MTRALQSTPVQNPGGPLSVTEKQTKNVVSNIGLHFTMFDTLIDLLKYEVQDNINSKSSGQDTICGKAEGVSW